MRISYSRPWLSKAIPDPVPSRLPAFIPWIFIARGWFSLNQKDSLTNTEADILGTGGEICLFVALSITPLITVTGARWFAPLRRWYGIMFALIGSRTLPPRPSRPTSPGACSAARRAYLPGDRALHSPHGHSGPGDGQHAGAAKARKTLENDPASNVRTLGVTVIHLLLLDGFKPFGAATGDGDPVFHQRFYQAVAISLPLVILRIPPVKRWVISKRQRPAMESTASRLGDRRTVPRRVHLHYQRRDPYRNDGLTIHPPTN